MAYLNKLKTIAVSARHYRSDPDYYKAKAKRYSVKTAALVRQYLSGYLACHPCIDCGEADPIVLEFDHRDRSLKLFTVKDKINGGVSLETIKAEVAKCDVRCANCHRRKTFHERKATGLKKVAPPALPLFSNGTDSGTPLPAFVCRSVPFCAEPPAEEKPVDQ